MPFVVPAGVSTQPGEQQFADNSTDNSNQSRVFVIRGLVAIAWAAAFAVVANSLTSGLTVAAGILLVLYPLIDVVAALLDARNQHGSARRLLLADAATSAVAAVALAGAATLGVIEVFVVFGLWAALAGAAQLVVAVRRRAVLGRQWPMLLAGAGSVVFGAPMLVMLVVYAATGGADFVIQALLVGRRRLAAVGDPIRGSR